MSLYNHFHVLTQIDGKYKNQVLCLEKTENKKKFFAISKFLLLNIVNLRNPRIMETWEMCHTVSIMLADYIIFRIIDEHNPNGYKNTFIWNFKFKEQIIFK